LALFPPVIHLQLDHVRDFWISSVRPLGEFAASLDHNIDAFFEQFRIQLEILPLVYILGGFGKTAFRSSGSCFHIKPHDDGRWCMTACPISMMLGACS
jgi:hypothetical protein